MLANASLGLSSSSFRVSFVGRLEAGAKVAKLHFLRSTELVSFRLRWLEVLQGRERSWFALNGTLPDVETGLEAENGAKRWPTSAKRVRAAPPASSPASRAHAAVDNRRDTQNKWQRSVQNLMSSCSRRRMEKREKITKIDSCQKQCVQQLECLSIARECDSRASSEGF